MKLWIVAILSLLSACRDEVAGSRQDAYGTDGNGADGIEDGGGSTETWGPEDTEMSTLPDAR